MDKQNFFRSLVRLLFYALKNDIKNSDNNDLEFDQLYMPLVDTDIIIMVKLINEYIFKKCLMYTYFTKKKLNK